MSELRNYEVKYVLGLIADNERLRARVDALEGVRDAAKELMWCDACETKWPEQYEALAVALREDEDE